MWLHQRKEWETALELSHILNDIGLQISIVRGGGGRNIVRIKCMSVNKYICDTFSLKLSSEEK